MATISKRMFDGRDAESELEEALDLAGAQYERLGFDDYDCSLELHDVPDDYRLSNEAQKVIHEAGFATAFVNHKNKWETHYNWPAGEFKEHAGWRVSYPHKRADGTQGILVEKPVESWPKDWFETGYAIVKQESSPTPTL